MKLLTNRQHDLYENIKICSFYKRKLEDEYAKHKKNIAELENVVVI